ncbi:PRC-barrel domain containing protein [Streptomyces sp. NPDC048825]|uniref:PRC-barrel domain containing protein n=1 Tax=Streptomyces sp. NPDC048825 TaxID=3365592 RepID=UPI00371053C2
MDRQADDAPRRHLIVDMGVWAFGKSVLVPAGLVTHIDSEAQKITVASTRDTIKSAPSFRTDREILDASYLDSVAAYYLGLPRRQAT